MFHGAVTKAFFGAVRVSPRQKIFQSSDIICNNKSTEWVKTMSQSRNLDESLEQLAGLTADDEGMLSTDEYVERVEEIAGVTRRYDENVLAPADSGVLAYDYAGIGPSHRVLDCVAELDDADEIEMQWRDGYGAVHPDLDLPIEEPQQTPVAVAIGRIKPTPKNLAAPVIALAHSREELADQLRDQVKAVPAGGES